MTEITERRHSGLAREFDRMAHDWREVAALAALKPDPVLRDVANVRASCWDIAADMAEKWHLAGEAS